MKEKAGAVSYVAALLPALLLTVAVLCLCVVDFGPGAWRLNIGLAAFEEAGGWPEMWTQFDHLFKSQMPTGNIWVEFQGFDPERPLDNAFMTGVYYRGNYTVYPRRIYVADPSIIINNSKPIVQRGGVLEQSLEERLGLRWTVVFSQNDQGSISYRYVTRRR